MIVSFNHKEMTCRQVAESVTDLFEGVLDRPVRESVEGHLDCCTDCSRFVEQVRSVRSWAGSVRQLQPSESREREVVRLLEHSRPGSGERCSTLSPDTVNRYLADSLPDEEQVSVSRHLLGGCTPCSGIARGIAFPRLEGAEAGRFEMRERHATEDEERRYLELSVHIEAEDWDAVRANDVDVRHFVRWLIRRSRNEVTIGPSEALRTAGLAWEAARDLGLRDRARAAMLKGHVARKIAADYQKAGRWFDLAEQLLRGAASCIESDLLLAQLHRMRGLSLYCQSRLSEAMRCFEEARSLYVRLGESERFGECLMDQAQVVAETQSPSAALAMAYRASTLVRRSGQPRNAMAFAQNIAGYQARQGNWERALCALRMAYEELDEIPQNLIDKVQLDWTCGRILNAAGQFEDARRVLEVARGRFVELGLASKTAWISLDLAISLIETKDLGRLRSVSESMIAYFASRRLPTETLVAIRLFQEAVVSQTIEVVQVRALEAALERSVSS
jgi:tetratricopeptide (TPR) repeat protein